MESIEDTIEKVVDTIEKVVDPMYHVEKEHKKHSNAVKSEVILKLLSVKRQKSKAR